MQDKLIIKNFSGIDYLEIELKKLNILIGAQASGKSTVAKLFYYFNGLFEDVQACIHQEAFKNMPYKMNLTEMLIGRFGQLFNHVFNDNEKFQIEYFFSKEYSIHIAYNADNDQKITLSYSNNLYDFINKKIEQYRKNIADKFIDEDNPLFSVHLMQEMKNIIRQDFLDKGIHFKKQIFIPAGRSYFATLHNNIFGLLDKEDRLHIDYVLKQFGMLYSTAKRVTQHYQISNQKIFENIIKAKYNIENDEEWLIHADGRKVNLASASSGQQEALPILLIIHHILENKIKHNDGLFLYVEEPEAHLFPTAQKDLVHLFARLFNHLKSDDCHILITTHSPYLLSSFNTLLTAGSVISQSSEKAEQVYKVIPENEILLNEQVGAYSLMNGQLKSLIDPEEELILADVLDEVSGIIADEFDKLLDLKYGN